MWWFERPRVNLVDTYYKVEHFTSNPTIGGFGLDTWTHSLWMGKPCHFRDLTAAQNAIKSGTMGNHNFRIIKVIEEVVYPVQ